MGLPSYELVTEDSDALEPQLFQSGSTDRDSFLPRRSWRGLEACAIATGAQQSELESLIERIRRLIDSTSDPLPSGTLTTPMIPVVDIKDLKISCSAPRTQERSWWRRGLERSISGSKRGIGEIGISLLQCIDGRCRSQLSLRPSKKYRPNLGLMKCPIETSNGLHSKNSTGEADCENPTDASNSCGETLTFVEGFAEKEQTVSAKTRMETVITNKATPTGWESLPDDLRENIILQRVDFRALFRFEILSKACNNHVESDDFRRRRGAISEGSFTGFNYYIKNEVWQCSGFDLHSKSWRSLPTFSCLPPPDAELFKEYSVTGHGGLMCAEVSKLPQKGKFVVFNPLTGKFKSLPCLLHPRNPVLVHISVDSARGSYKVIVAGSSTAGDEHLSRKMEVFDSSTSEWKETCDLPEPAFGLNEHQAGVCLDGTLFFISFLEGDGGRGVVAFDVEKGEWLKDMTCPIPFFSYSNTLQLVENDGKVYLFSEQERGASVEHCIDELEIGIHRKAGAMACWWRNVVQVKKSGGRGLLVYRGFTFCVGFGKRKLCICTTLKRVGAVNDMVRKGLQCEVVEQVGISFSLNPASDTARETFHRSPPAYQPWKQPLSLRAVEVTVAGSPTASDEYPSRKTEIFDSSTFKRKEGCDLPGPAIGLNENQAGVCLDGRLFFIAFLEGDCRRGAVAFDVEQGKWLENLECPIPFSSCSNTVQLVVIDGKVHLFSEQKRGQCVEHCIDELEFPNPDAEANSCQWRGVVRVRTSGGRGLLVYPEYTFVGFGEGKLLILNALKRDGVVYGRQCEVFHRASRLQFCVVRQFTPSYFVTVLRLVLLPLLASMLNGAAAADDHQSGTLNPTNVWDFRDCAKVVAVTTFLAALIVRGLIMFVARVTAGINHQRQGPPAPGDDFDIMGGLERHVVPTKSNKEFDIWTKFP